MTSLRALTLNGVVTYLDRNTIRSRTRAIVAGTFSVGATKLTGTRRAGIPEFSVSVGRTFNQQLTDSIRFLSRTDLNDQTPMEVAEGVIALEREVKAPNLAATLQFDNGLELSGWARNVTSAQYVTTLFSSLAQWGSVSTCPNQPRTYRATVRYKFRNLAGRQYGRVRIDANLWQGVTTAQRQRTKASAPCKA